MSEIIPHPNAAEHDPNTNEYRVALHRFLLDQCGVNYSLATDMIHLLQRVDYLEKRIALLEAKIGAYD